jgi:hypothetical protein
MKTRMRRRAIYATTIVSILALTAGFVLASNVIGPFTGPTVVNGNQGTVTSGNTIYQSGISASTFWTSAAGSLGTCTGSSSSTTADEVVVTGWVAGGPGACTTTVDYILQLTFTSADTLTLGATETDRFVISSEFNGASSYTTDSVVLTCSLVSSDNQCQAVINIDSGVATTNPQTSVNNIDVTITGS